jgi:CRP/FNR family transcriptional regulator, cyclic AMP receptor protein
MKSLFERFKGGAAPAGAGEHAADDEGFFATQFMERPDSFRAASAWNARALGVGAHAIDKERGLAAFDKVWGKDHFLAALDAAEKRKLLDYLDFVTVPAGRELIVQDERGDYALVLLNGVVAVDRLQPTGVRARLAEARDGDVLGEMSLVDAGARFASCVTLSTCELAVFTSTALDDMAIEDPRLGMALMASMARRLSLRTRQYGARLGALLVGQEAEGVAPR